MKRTSVIAKNITILLLLMIYVCNKSLSQEQPLRHGEMVVEGVMYSITISNKYSDVYVEEDSLFEKTKALVNPKLGTTSISEDFIFVNTDKLLEIKRRFYPRNIRADIRVTITKEGEFMGLDYILPKMPMITVRQFRDLDAQIRKHLKVSVVFPAEWVKNQEYNGYATKYLKME